MAHSKEKSPNQQSVRLLKKQALKFINENRVGMLATVDINGTPHSSIVYCIAQPDLSIYFMTREEARKYHNMQHNHVISLSFVNEPKMMSLQLTGRADKIMELKQEQKMLYELITTRYKESDMVPPPLQLFNKSATSALAVFKVTPTEMTLGDFGPSADNRFNRYFRKVI